jgi:hypothetical protein
VNPTQDLIGTETDESDDDNADKDAIGLQETLRL